MADSDSNLKAEKEVNEEVFNYAFQTSRGIAF